MRSNTVSLFCVIFALLLFGGCGGVPEASQLPSDPELEDLSSDLFGMPAPGSGGSSGSSILGGNTTPPNGGSSGKALPSDFPAVKDTGGMGQGATMPSWGGDPSKDQQGNRAALKRTPVILVHGNGASAYGNPVFEFMWNLKWDTMVKALQAKGYNASEIWAVSYLGKSPAMAQMQNPYTTNIDDLRNFIDAVRGYLGVQKVDLITHSLGVQLAKGYINGLQRSGKWDYSQNRLDAVGAMVGMAGANYGFGNEFDMYASMIGEFLTGKPFEKGCHLYKGVVDDTPGGPALKDQKTSGTAVPSGKWQDKDYRGVTSLDDGSINYVAIWHEEDQVDKYYDKTGRLWGANLNHGVTGLSSDAMKAHIALLHNAGVFNAFYPYLNKVGVVKGKGVPATPGSSGGSTGGSSGGSTGGCKAVTATTYGHVIAGRATVCGMFHACAKGSKDDLGQISVLTKVSLAETKSGHFKKGGCP